MALSLCSPCPCSGVRGTLPPRHRLWTEALRGEAAEPCPGARCRLRRVPAVATRGDGPLHPHCPQGLRGGGGKRLPCPCRPQGPAATLTRVPTTSRALGTGPPRPCSTQGHVVSPACLRAPQRHPHTHCPSVEAINYVLVPPVRLLWRAHRSTQGRARGERGPSRRRGGGRALPGAPAPRDTPSHPSIPCPPLVTDSSPHPGQRFIGTRAHTRTAASTETNK